MAGEKFIALEETSQEIKESVNDVKTNVDGLKETDVPAIDTLVDAVLERIGLTDDTGGSTNLGSVMAKLNEIISEVGKSSSEISTTGFGTTVFEYKDKISIYNSDDNKVIAKFIAPVTGIYNIKFLAKCTETGRTSNLIIYNPPNVKQLIYYASSKTGISSIYRPYDLFSLLNTIEIGQDLSGDSYDDFLKLSSYMSAVTEIDDIADTEATYNNLIHCYQGDPVFIYVGSNSYSFRDVNIQNIVITYGNE